ncbi:MAG: hypothetical protein M3R63_19815 [Actinomycetota bacterium]|nr:hypothetical protein [Actinomycetota bacterium]
MHVVIAWAQVPRPTPTPFRVVAPPTSGAPRSHHARHAAHRMLTVPGDTGVRSRTVRPRDVAAGVLLSVGFVVATAAVSGDGALGPVTAAPELLQTTPGADSTHGSSPAAHDSTVNASMITTIREAGQSMGDSGVVRSVGASPVAGAPSTLDPTPSTRPAGLLVPGDSTAPEMLGVGGAAGPGVQLPGGVGVPLPSGADVPDDADVPDGADVPSGRADPGPLAPLVETAAPVVRTAAPVVKTVAKPVTDVVAPMADGAQPALTMVAPSLL